MSKVSPLGQSMAALFTPESEKLRSAQKGQANGATATGAFRVPGAQAPSASRESQDSLGNPMSPGYEPLNLKKKAAEEPPAQSRSEENQAVPGFQAKELGPQFIRLGAGWEKLLMTQKKMCEKAKGLFTLLEGPLKYRGQRKSSVLEEKSRGAILDLDVEELREKSEAERKTAERESRKKKDAA